MPWKPVVPDDPVQEALRRYVKAGDRLRHAEAQIQGNVMSDFHLSADWAGQAERLIDARSALAEAYENLQAAVMSRKRAPDANAQSPQVEEPAPGP